MAAFLSNSNFLKYYNWQFIGELCSDDGTRVTEENLATDDNLTAALTSASGIILSAANQGNRYAESDLTSLTGNSLGLLERLTADLAVYFLVVRRGNNVDDYPQTIEARKTLDQIKSGERVFGVAANVSAGVAQNETYSKTTIENQNFVRDRIKMFPSRKYSSDQ